MTNIANRDSFLANLSKSLGRPMSTTVTKQYKHDHIPKATLSHLNKGTLIDVLKKQCDNIHTTFCRTTKDALLTTLQRIIDNYGPDYVIIPDDPKFNENCYRHILNDLNATIKHWDESDVDHSISLATHANIGITFSDVTLAESGTVTVTSRIPSNRIISLLPKYHIVLIEADTIVPRLTGGVAYFKDKEIPSSINFITGPSNSADIELNLVVGVHGPIGVSYIVIE
ncbi:MAG: lactate utilization protein C [Bacillaceae bacterium]